MKPSAILLPIFVLFPHFLLAQNDYSFDLSQIEKETERKPYSLGGYLELRPNFFWLDKDAALYNLSFYDDSKRSTLDEYNLELLLDASYQKRIFHSFLRTNAKLSESSVESSGEITILEGYVSLKPTPLLTVDLGKKTLKWGKGYAWNPVAFVDRPKDPDDPGLPLEGFIVASADYIKSFSGPLRTVSFTPVIVPVYQNINDDFGQINSVDFAGKLYFLFHDTDIDFMFFRGSSKPSRFGIDFSRNISSNCAIHGEFAFVDDFEKIFIDSNGMTFQERYDAKSYILGMRYLTKHDTTFIFEYYRNDTGYDTGEMNDFFEFVNEWNDLFLTSGDDALLKKASAVAEKGYAARSSMADYLYTRISQKEPFGWLYFTPSVTWIFNVDDESYSLSPELLYTGITNLQLRLKAGFIVGQRDTEYGEKRNDYRLEFRLRYYFDATKF
ncbi:MAG: hypothetical protein SWH78_09025 [Thermodesulfobacteriota bacterium]|nr:hypothetical protein [Thermodesulfobacteriota bacterium]